MPEYLISFTRCWVRIVCSLTGEPAERGHPSHVTREQTIAVSRLLIRAPPWVKGFIGFAYQPVWLRSSGDYFVSTPRLFFLDPFPSHPQVWMRR